MQRHCGPLSLVVATCLVSACGGAEPVAPGPPPLPRLTVLPSPAEVTEGDTLRLVASVAGRPAARFRWSTGDPASATVDPTGLLAAQRCPTRGSTVVNIEVAEEPPVRLVVPIFIRPIRRLLQIYAIRDSSTGNKTNLLAVAGTVIIEAGPEYVFECGRIDSLVADASGIRAGVIDLSGWTPSQGSPVIRWASATRANGVPVYPNGRGVLRLLMYVTQSKTPIASNAVPIVIANPSEAPAGT